MNKLFLAPKQALAVKGISICFKLAIFPLLLQEKWR